ncbi:MAG: DUF5677 domain-containing protein [Pseudomonadota bacterium]
MEGKPQDYGVGLATQAEMLRAASKFDAKLSDQPIRDKYARFTLTRTADLVGACALFVEPAHIVAGHVLMRSMLEDLIKILWATISESNAEKLCNASIDHLKNIMRANNEGGTARITDKQGKDHSARFLKSDRLAPSGKKKSVEAMARDVGAVGIYDMFYRFASIQTHGNAVGPTTPNTAADVLVVLSGVGAVAKATGHTAIRWLLGRERPSNKDLVELLGVWRSRT